MKHGLLCDFPVDNSDDDCKNPARKFWDTGELFPGEEGNRFVKDCGEHEYSYEECDEEVRRVTLEEYMIGAAIETCRKNGLAH